MNEIGNIFTITQSGFLIDDLKNISKIQVESLSSALIEAKITDVTNGFITLRLGFQTIKAENKSSYPLTQGDTIVMLPVKYQNNKIFYKIMNVIKNDTTEKGKIGEPILNKLDIMPKYLDLFSRLSNAKEFDKNIPSSIVIDIEDLPEELVRFIKSSIMFTGKMVKTDENFLLQIGNRFFTIDKSTIADIYHKGFPEHDGIMKFLDKEVVGLIRNSDERLLIFEKSDLLFDNLERLLKAFSKDFKIQPKDESDYLAVFDLLINKRWINKEEFLQTKLHLNKFIKRLSDIFDLHYGIENKGEHSIKANFFSKDDLYLLFKIFDGSDEIDQKGINQMLNQFDNPSKTHLKFDFGYYIVDMFYSKWNFNQRGYDLKIFVNKKKGSDYKSSSIMIRLTTDNLGDIGIYVKKLYSKSYRIIFISNRLSTIKAIQDRNDVLIDSLADKGYILNIEYKLDNLESSNIILDYLKYEIDINKIDMRV